MVTRGLIPVFSTWELGEGGDEPRRVFVGRMRIVNRQRARKLRRRGVELMRHIGTTATGKHLHAWFVELPI